MAIIESYNRSVNVLSRFSSIDGSTTKVIYEPGQLTPYDIYTNLRYYGLLTDLRIKVDISSIPEASIPNLSLLATQSDKIQAAREMEWNSPRKELRLYLATSNQPQCHIATISLLNRRPYYHVNLVPYLSDNGVFNIANDAMLLASIQDVGYGLLQGNDEVVIFGSVREEMSAIPTQPRVIQYTEPFSLFVGSKSINVLQANSYRVYAHLENHSTANIWINFGAIAQVGQGIRLGANERFEINAANLYKGAISAIADLDDGVLIGLEGF